MPVVADVFGGRVVGRRAVQAAGAVAEGEVLVEAHLRRGKRGGREGGRRGTKGHEGARRGTKVGARR